MDLQDWQIAAVKVLGQKIGYGNLMEIAHSLWAESLSKDGTDRTSGAFYPVSINSVKKHIVKEIETSRLAMRKRIKEYLKQ